MKVGCRILPLACAFLLAWPFPAFGHAENAESYDGEQILLSWSEEAAHSQTITWHSPSGKAGYVQYNESGKALSKERQIKARATEVGKTGYYRYEAVIKDLHQQTTYEYRIGDGTNWSRVRNFITAPESKGNGNTAAASMKKRVREALDQAIAAFTGTDGWSETDAASSFEFLYLGDVQYQDRYGDYKVWGKLAQDIRERHPGIKFALSGGDMVNSSRQMKEWELFLQSAEPVFSYIPLMPAIGNHDASLKAASDSQYLQLMALPENGPEGLEEAFYSFDYANCHMVILNSCFFEEERQALSEERATEEVLSEASSGGTSSKDGLSEGGLPDGLPKEPQSEAKWEIQREQINRWLQEDLAQSKATWKIAVIHHPAYGISDGDPIYRQIRQQWEPILKAGDVDVVFCGHQHLYARTEEIGGITYIMGNSGKRRSTYFDGENAPDYMEAIDATNSNYQIVRVGEKELSVTSYDEEGQIIDRWTKKGNGFSGMAIAAFGVFAAHILGIGAFLILRRKKRGHWARARNRRIGE